MFLETLLQHDRENWFNLVKPMCSLSSDQKPECYRDVILFLFDNNKIIWAREQDVGLTGRNPSVGLRSKPCRGQGPTANILPAVAETEPGSTFNQGDGQWVEGHPHKCLLACLLLSTEHHENRCAGPEKFWLGRPASWCVLLLLYSFAFLP